MAKPTTTTPADHQPDTSAGIAAYSSIFLRYIYDHLVLGLYCTFAWRCRTRPTLINFFNTHMPTPSPTAPPRRILDIGVGTGYFLAQAPLAASRVADVVLVDLNANCLARTAPRVEAAHRRAAVRCVPVQADFYALRLPPHVEGTFDAVSVMLLLHCLPGPPARKAAALCGLKHLVEREEGVLFGATVLGDGGEGGHNLFGRFLMRWHNGVGIFDNREDGVEAFVGPLREAFRVVEWRVEGAMLLFEARGPIL